MVIFRIGTWDSIGGIGLEWVGKKDWIGKKMVPSKVGLGGIKGTPTLGWEVVLYNSQWDSIKTPIANLIIVDKLIRAKRI